MCTMFIAQVRDCVMGAAPVMYIVNHRRVWRFLANGSLFFMTQLSKLMRDMLLLAGSIHLSFHPSIHMCITLFYKSYSVGTMHDIVSN